MILEVCAYNIQSCIIAEKSGASRIELCADPMQGGTTPSYGLLEYAIANIGIPIFPMIRPRGGNFIYDEDELAIMQRDIVVCRALGFKGIATGVQLSDGRINKEALKRLVDCAGTMEVTCHKVFDGTPDALVALEDLISTGCSRVLTSGLGKTATRGTAMLSQLVAHAAGRLIIMPGGGVRSSNIAQLASSTGATEYHSSGIISKEVNSVADAGEITQMVQELALLSH